MIKMEDLSAIGRTTASVADDVLQIWLHPRQTFTRVFAETVPFENAIVFATGMFIVASALSAAVGIAGKLEASSVVYVAIGTTVVWLLYAVFMHGFAYLLGARRGLKATVAAYMLTIGALQPVFVVLFAFVTYLMPGSVEFRDIVGGMGVLAVSGPSEYFVLATGNLLSWNAAVLLRTICSVLVLIYFTLALGQAHRISYVRAVLSVLLSGVFWLAVYAFIYAYGFFAGWSPVVRLLQGT